MGVAGLAACGLELEVAPETTLDGGDAPVPGRRDAAPPTPPERDATVPDPDPDSGTTACATGTGDCNGLAEDGCEVDLTSDLAHCGECPTACAAGIHGTAACTNGLCGIACDADRLDRNGDLTDGCEIDVRNDPDHCSSLDIPCPGGPNATRTCTGSVCGLECAAGFGNCDGLSSNGCEADLNTNALHCGACLGACLQLGVTSVCSVGECKITACPMNYADCNENYDDRCETNITDDEQNCGECGTVCPAPQQCRSRSCVVP